MTEHCVFNAYIVCPAEGSKCYKCGWNPKAEEKRKSGGGDEWDMSGLSGSWGKDGAGMRAYSCPSCCAEIICDENTAATSCPYCGNPVVLTGHFAGLMKPDLVFPFKVDKKAAKEANNPVLSPVYLREAGLLLENEKKNEEALALYEQIKSEYPSSTLVSTQVGPNGLTSQIDQDITRVSK